MQQTRQLLSIVVPCFDEEAVLETTHRQLTAMANRLDDLDYEIIYADDGSRDTTPDILHRIQRGDSRVRVIRLSRNFGHQVAVTAGLEHASGDAIVPIDADLQEPPSIASAELVLERGDAQARRDTEIAAHLSLVKGSERVLQ